MKNIFKRKSEKVTELNSLKLRFRGSLSDRLEESFLTMLLGKICIIFWYIRGLFHNYLAYKIEMANYLSTYSHCNLLHLTQ